MRLGRLFGKKIQITTIPVTSARFQSISAHKIKNVSEFKPEISS